MTPIQILQYKKLQKVAKAQGFHFIGINADGSVHAFNVTYNPDTNSPQTKYDNWYTHYEGNRLGGGPGIKMGQIGLGVQYPSQNEMEEICDLIESNDPIRSAEGIRRSDEITMPFKEWKETLVKIW